MTINQYGDMRVTDDDDLTAPVSQTYRLTQDEAITPRGPWSYDGGDPAILLFTAAAARFNLTFPPHSRILELGCAETDWLERMHRWDPTFQLFGVDARHQERGDHPDIRIMQADAMDADLFDDCEPFDRIVLLGALEHFGLGFYGDPVDVDGDTQTMRNIARWLRPGGLVYFDVPCQPTFRIAANRHFRSYAAQKRVSTGLIPLAPTRGSVDERLIVPGLREVNRAYSLPEPHAGTWCQEPTVDRVPYWFVAVVAEKL